MHNASPTARSTLPPNRVASYAWRCLQELDMADVYAGLQPGDHWYTLRSMVGFYGAHYFALVRDPGLQQWLLLDDALVSVVGNWGHVLRKCQLGHIQPSVLFFEHV